MQRYIDRLSKIKRAAAIFVTGNYKKTSSVTALTQSLGWKDLQTRDTKRVDSLVCQQFEQVDRNSYDLISVDEKTLGRRNLKHTGTKLFQIVVLIQHSPLRNGVWFQELSHRLVGCYDHISQPDSIQLERL